MLCCFTDTALVVSVKQRKVSRILGAFVPSIIVIVVKKLAVRIELSKRPCENVKFMSSERRIVREYTLFNNQVCFKVYFDENLVLSIIVDRDSMQFSIPQFDCDLEVLSNESTILVKLYSLFKNDLEDLGVC